MKVYLSGPMRGRKDYNGAAFTEAEQRWRRAGHQPFNPARMGASLGYLPEHDTGEDVTHLLHVVQLDVACVCNSDAIALLPGWETSRGVTVELALAQFLKLPVYDAVTMQPIQPSLTPWSLVPNPGPREDVKGRNPSMVDQALAKIGSDMLRHPPIGERPLMYDEQAHE